MVDGISAGNSNSGIGGGGGMRSGLGMGGEESRSG